MKNAALTVAGFVFSFVTIMHVLRYFKTWEIIIANFNVPLQWSIYGVVISGLLAIWMFVAALK